MKNSCAALAERVLVQCFDKRRREIFEVLTTTRARSSKSFIPCLCMKTIRAKQERVHFAYFVPRDQHGIIAY